MKTYGMLLFIFVMTGLISCSTSSETRQTPPETADATAPLPAAAPRLEEVFADSVYQFTGVAVSPEGRLFTNYPYWLDTHAYSVVEIIEGKAVPYPDTAWNNFRTGEDGQHQFVCVQAVVADDQGSLWIVDAAGIGLGAVYQQSNKVVKVDLASNQVERIYRFPDSVAGKDSYLNDIRVDHEHGFAYLTSSSNGGIVVLDLNTGASRFVLHDSPSVVSDPAYHIRFEGKAFTKADGSPVQINSDGIALTPDRDWLYYKPLTDDKLYRIRTHLLRDFSLPQATLVDSVQDLGHFTTTDGMAFDRQGNLYVGDLEQSSLVKITPDLGMQTLVRDTTRLVWPDSYSISTDGYLYVSTTQIQRMPWFNGNVNRTRYPYQIFRIKL
ncbi:Sugar lactone lactonase YvrE [Catalinimonas alkaloidigena]|uniref:Sugar lactone lactonase YvrE n=1 Tax=Catalinimonas alkaloidigena TaxID=1075417 RepID=A0A1G9P5D3_9BACT|nr:L-dopachrome tautomerase-related protein [Catalinimonas alkaloidigena]SDL93437.1 Sugar lactone lactonase YvrE [Catalinimonas alkaloidigena]